MATQVASLYGLLTLDASDWDNKLKSADSGLAGLGSKLQGVGKTMTLATAPIAAGLGVSVKAAADFDESMTNVAAVMGMTGSETAAMSKEILNVGRKARSGPQAVADAMYDIAGGVADASSHMAILNASVATSEAGNADLAGTTSALISIMNSYGFSADQAGFASDVLTQTVGKGTGSMDEFASALPQVTGLASSLGISFDDLGGMMAYLTTQGTSTSQSATQLGAMMTALLNPNEKMKKAMGELGLESGSAAIANLGLVGVFKKLSTQSPTFQSNMAGAVGSVEALRGVTAFGSDNAVDALAAFSNGLDGATAAAREIQNQSFTAQWDLLNAGINGVGITIGTALLPTLNNLISQLMPVIDRVTEWMTQNPEVTQTLVMLAGALVLVGPLVAALGTAIGMIASPIGIVIAAVVALGAAYMTNFGGIRDFIDTQVMPLLGKFWAFLGGVWEMVRPALEAVYNWFVNDALPAIGNYVTNTVLPAVQGLFNWIGGVWDTISPALAAVYDWFVTTALPEIQRFIENTVLPAVQGLFDFIGGVWDFISPVLEDVYDWFVTSGLPAVNDFIGTVVQTIGDFVTTIQNVWTAIQPYVQALADGIVRLLQPVATFIKGLIDGIAAIQNFEASKQTAREATSGLSNDQLWQRTLAAAGGNDFMARIAFSQLRADGGPVNGGQPYVVGERGPELFVPGQSGAIVPNGAMGGVSISGLTIYANDAAGGRAAADAFERRIGSLLAARGGV